MPGPKLQRVAWSEGMFLSPHHMQHTDRVSEAQLAYHLQLVNPFHWGVLELALDSAALADHRVQVSALTAILRGGAVVSPDPSDVEPRKFDPSRSGFSVFAGISHLPGGREGGLPSGASAKQASRYQVQSIDVTNLIQPDSIVSVPVLTPHVRLFLSGEEAEAEAFDILRIAEIEATGSANEPFRVRPTYAPPILTVEAWPPLKSMLESLVNHMQAKVRLVAASRASMTRLDTARMLLGYTLARMAPVLTTMLASKGAHPHLIYTALVETAAGLVCMTRDSMLEVPPYDHTEIYRTFADLAQLIKVELDREFKERSTEVQLPFVAASSAYAASGLSHELLDTKNAFYIGVKAELDSEELVRLVMTEARLSSISGLEFIVKHSTKGVRLEHLPAPPIDVDPRPGFVFFRVEPSGRASSQNQWRKILDEHSLALSLGRIEQADVRFFAVEPE